jgi:hypothetical protein
MSYWNTKIGTYFSTITFILLIFLILVSSWSVSWHITAEVDFLNLTLCAYALFLVLPITKFRFGPSGFEGELERLVKDRKLSPVQTDIVEEVNKEVVEFSQNLVESDLILMRLSIEIETTLRNIAEKSGLRHTKVSMGMLVNMLRRKEIITDHWLIEALHFFQIYRNELIHEGKTSDLHEAINVGGMVLAKLRQIQKERGMLS